jgi:hypothetical protein
MQRSRYGGGVTRAPPDKSKIREDKNLNGQQQAKELRNHAPPLAFDQKDLCLQAVEHSDWFETFAELDEQLSAPGEDRRMLAQLAWLVCAGVPILATVRDGLGRVATEREQGNQPRSPMAYLRRCLDELIGRDCLEGLLKLAPKRAECARILEGLE